MDWKTTGNPNEEGVYLVTTLQPIIVDSRHGPESYAYMTDFAYYNGCDWDIPREFILAWAEKPEPWTPTASDGLASFN